MSMQCKPSIRVSAESFEEQAAFFKALGDPHRLTILSALLRADEPVCVCDFTSELPLNQPTVSHHLKILRDTGIVKSERRGTWVYYSLNFDLRDRVIAHIDALAPLVGAR
jgi:ArsR family transcriptional regulator